MNIAIVDDNPSDLYSLQAMLGDELARIGLSDHTFSLFSSGKSFLESWRAGVYSLIILDIFIGDMLGVDIAQKIRAVDDAALLVFSTTSNEFAAQSYHVGCSFYLHKPIERGHVALMLQRIDQLRMARNRFIELRDGSRLLLHQIMYTERYKHYISFHLADGTIREARITQAEAGKQLLSGSEFCAVGQGNIVNLDHALELTPRGFVMSDRQLIGVPRRKMREMRETYNRHLFNKALRGGAD